ncbi:MAG TPA: flagellar motor switch protein FliM [Burkholderiaceae bacterium]|nr:flagellar motor switch protein FliM [Burkholderiaceae bacterium]
MADQFLSQDEVDALLEDVTGESQHVEEAAKPADGIRSYDLASQERIVRGRMPALEIVNDRFARNLRIGLFNFMRRTPEVSINAVKVQKYGAFLRDIVVPTNINVVQVKPLRGNGLIICDPALVFGAIDSLFGGNGKLHTRFEGRDFSATEQRIIQRLVEVAIAEYKKAWEGIFPLQLEYVRSEMHTQFAAVATPSEIVVTTSFSLEIGDVSAGQMHICIPYSTFEPIRELLFSTLAGDATEPDKRWVRLLTHQIQSAEVELVAELAHANARLGDLLELEVGDFIELDIKPLIDVKVDQVPLLTCRYGTHTGRYAIQVERFETHDHELNIGDSHA